jgi:pimeloyl-ACP methyl ester carboxylesterase
VLAHSRAVFRGCAFPVFARLGGGLSAVLLVLSTGCVAPVGADRKAPSIVYRQTHENAVSRAQPSRETQSVLHRFDEVDRFANSPDATLEMIHQKAVQSGERGLTFALSELSYLAGERLRRSVKPWEPHDARDYYLASAAYAWCFLFGDASDPPPDPFDQRFHTACALYNYGLGWALTGRRSTNAEIALAGGTRRLPVGQIEMAFAPAGFPWPLNEFDRFILADQLLVRGLSVRNRQPGLGAPLVAVMKRDEKTGFARSVPATVLLRLHGGLSELAAGRCRGSLELHSAFDAATVQVGERAVPLEADTTVALAYGLNQSFIWRLGMLQFLSAEERIPTDVYLMQPYQPGRVPVVFVHGTFSSPVWWSEMVNTLSGDPVLQKRCQFWQFLYNSGNPTADSAVRLREALAAKLQELDPGGQDPALRQMVVIGHSQGGLLTKLTATDTGDRLWQTLLKTNRLEGFALTANQEALLRRYTCYQALPFVTRVVFISTPHRGSYLAGSFVRRLARKIVSLPSRLVNLSKEFAGLTAKLDLPRELRGTPTSLDSMSPKNPGLLALAEIPLAPGVKGHSIIAVKGQGDYHQGKDGLVTYESAHLDDVESEFIVRSGHSCQDKPPTIEEVRRILRRHLAALPAPVTNR